MWCPQRDKWQWFLSHMLAIIMTIWSDAVLHFYIFSIDVLNVKLSEGPSVACRIISGSQHRSISSTWCSFVEMKGLKSSTSSGHRGGHKQHPWAAAALQREQDAPREGAQHKQLYQLMQAECAGWVLRGTDDMGRTVTWWTCPFLAVEKKPYCSIFTRERQHDVCPLSNQRSALLVSDNDSSSCLGVSVGIIVWLEAQGQAPSCTFLLYPPSVYLKIALAALFRAA